MPGIAIITESCIGVKDRACVDVCPVQCIYEFDSVNNVLFSEVEAGGGVENTHQPNPDMVAVFADSMLYVNLDECTSCTACYQPDVCPSGRSTQKSTSRTDRPTRSTTRLTPTKVTITRSSSSTAATSSPTDFDSSRSFDRAEPVARSRFSRATLRKAARRQRLHSGHGRDDGLLAGAQTISTAASPAADWPSSRRLIALAIRRARPFATSASGPANSSSTVVPNSPSER